MKQKIFTLALIAIIMQATAFAQPVIKAQRVAGDSFGDFLASMCLTKDGVLLQVVLPGQ
jgi:hypothetical protein